MGIDCRDLPYTDGYIDCIVLDPPYMEGNFIENLQRQVRVHIHHLGKHTQMAMKDSKVREIGHGAVTDMYFLIRQRSVFEF